MRRPRYATYILVVVQVSARRREVWLPALLVLLGGLFLMHGVSAHHQMVPTAQVAAIDQVNHLSPAAADGESAALHEGRSRGAQCMLSGGGPCERPAAAALMDMAAVCVAILTVSLLAVLAWLRGRARPESRRAVRRAFTSLLPDDLRARPPSLITLGISRT